MEHDRQDWWHEDPPEPLEGLTLASMAIAVLAILLADPLLRLWNNFARKGAKTQRKD